MKNFFNGLKTVADVKKEYRRLANIYHPDHGGDTRTMQIINEQYHNTLKSMDGQQAYSDDQKVYTYHYNYDIEQSVLEVLYKLLSLKMEDVEIYIIGTWVWVLGNTRPYKEDLKKLGLIWHGKRMAWYYRKHNFAHRMSNKSLSWIATYYGGYNVKDIMQPEERRIEQ